MFTELQQITNLIPDLYFLPSPLEEYYMDKISQEYKHPCSFHLAWHSCRIPEMTTVWIDIPPSCPTTTIFHLDLFITLLTGLPDSTLAPLILSPHSSKWKKVASSQSPTWYRPMTNRCFYNKFCTMGYEVLHDWTLGYFSSLISLTKFLVFSS